jgi:hypothetical protein
LDHNAGPINPLIADNMLPTAQRLVRRMTFKMTKRLLNLVKAKISQKFPAQYKNIEEPCCISTESG